MGLDSGVGVSRLGCWWLVAGGWVDDGCGWVFMVSSSGGWVGVRPQCAMVSVLHDDVGCRLHKDVDGSAVIGDRFGVMLYAACGTATWRNWHQCHQLQEGRWQRAAPVLRKHQQCTKGRRILPHEACVVEVPVWRRHTLRVCAGWLEHQQCSPLVAWGTKCRLQAGSGRYAPRLWWFECLQG
jgi:hypothetical protein